MKSRDVLVPRLARIIEQRRGGSHVTVLWDRAPGDRRRGRELYGGRLAYGAVLATAASREIMGLNPVIRFMQVNGKMVEVRPWLRGAESAWAYLRGLEETMTGRSTARRYIAFVEREGFAAPARTSAVDQLAEGGV